MVKKVLNLFPFWFVTTSTLTPNPGEGTPPWAGGPWGGIFDAPVRGAGGGAKAADHIGYSRPGNKRPIACHSPAW